MTGLSSVLQPLSTDSTLLKPTDDHHRDRGKPPPIDSAIIVDPPPPAPQSLAGRQPPPVPLPSTLNESENSPPAIRHHRYSLAAIAREKTNNALANLSLRPKPSSQSLHSSSSSSGSPTKLESTVGGSTTQRTPNPKPTISDLSQTRSAEADVSRPIERTHPAPIDHLASSNQPQRRDEERASPPAQEPASAPTTRNLQGALSKMHQTSSRLLRMTDEERPFTRDFEDLFSTLMVSLPLSAHRVRFQKVEHTFTSEEAINNLGSLKFSQSNRMPDPKDPSRIVTTTTTTTFSMAKEMARSVCQRFMDARFIESADGKYIASFPLKNAVWQLTPKGMHVLTRFCQRNGINQRHVLDVLDSARNTMQLVILERDSTTDKLSHDRATIEVIFRRFTGQEGPNLKLSITSSDSDSLSDYYNGLIGVKMAKERKILDQSFKNTFTGKAAIDWLMDCCTTVDRREVYEIAELFVSHGLMLSVLEDKVFIHQNPGASRFQPTKNAIYLLSEKGERVVGWRADDKDSDDARTVSVKTGNGKKDRGSARDSNNNRLHAIVTDAALRLLFREFLRDTHCEENLSFYLEVRDFTKSYDNAEKGGLFNRPDAIRENLAAAYGLYNAFLAPGSPCELNIDHNLRNSLAGRMTRAVGDDGTMFQGLQEVVALFREAQASVFRLMYSDSVPKFLKEPKYAAMLSQHNFDNSSPSSHPSTSTSIPERSKSRAVREGRVG
ncbi:human AMSH/STAMBP protein ubiquitin specific-protease [Xanthoria calcicola]